MDVNTPWERGRFDAFFELRLNAWDMAAGTLLVQEAEDAEAVAGNMFVPIDLLDVGGGMAVDYDGSKTAFDSSANYTAQEFANDVIYTIKQVCDDENVPHPTIIQESGRFLAAYHAILVTNVLDEIETVVEDITPIAIDEDDPQVVIELGDLRESITVKNYREYYHDALEHRAHRREVQRNALTDRALVGLVFGGRNFHRPVERKIAVVDLLESLGVLAR